MAQPPRRGGPYPRLRVPFDVKAREGFAVYELVLGGGLSFRQAAAQLDMSLSTAWRRYWFFTDWTTPERHGCKPGPLPPQRGTARCPRGAPYLPTLHGPGGPFYQGGI